MARLTKAQREFLERVSRDTHGDNSGRGARAFDGHEIRTAESLRRKGLLTIPIIWTIFSGAKITEAGRLALKQEAGDA